MLKNEVIELLETELSLSKRRLMEEVKDDIEKWTKKRFWIVSFLTFFGLAGVINLLLNVSVGKATNSANEAAIEAQYVAKSASVAIAEIELSIRKANDAATEANQKASLASESAEDASTDASDARLQASKAQAATEAANATIEILQSEKIKTISETIIALDSRIKALTMSAVSLEKVRTRLDPEVQRLIKLGGESTALLDLNVEKIESVSLREAKTRENVAEIESTLSKLSIDALSLQKKVDAISEVYDGLNSDSQEIIETIRSGSILSQIVEYERLKGELRFTHDAMVTDAISDIKAGTLIEKGVHCSMPSMPGFGKLKDRFDELGRRFIPEVVYATYPELVRGLRVRECNIILIADEFASKVARRIPADKDLSFLNPQITQLTGDAFIR